MPNRWGRVLIVFSGVLIVGWLMQFVAGNIGRTAGVATPQGTTGVLVGVGFMAAAVGICTATLGWYYFRQADQETSRRINHALSDFRKRLGIEQAKHEESQRHLVNGYVHWFDRQDLDAAVTHFEHAVRAFPHGLGGYVALGYAYYSRGETEKAFDLFNKALSLYPDRKEPYRDIAGLFIREGDLVRALEYVEQAVQVDPSVRRDLLEDPLFDILKHEERTRDRYERAITG